MVKYYDSIKQKPVSPPKSVFKFEANEAVNYFKPDMVIGSWITEKYRGGDNGSMWGVDEETMLSKIKYYIHIGNDNTHNYKFVFQNSTQETFRFPWLVSRGRDKSKNHIKIIQGGRK